MSKVKADQMIKDLKHIEERWTEYNNTYPYNCGYIWAAGFLSFDCIGLIKSYLNNPRIAYKTKPKGSWVQPGQVVPDGYGVVDMMKACGKKSREFTKIEKCTLLEYEDRDHAGVYVGQFKDPSGVVNVIECCNDPVGSGVVTSYIDKEGNRWDHKDGICLGKWIYWGKMTKWVEYPEAKKEEKKTVTAIAKEVISGKWGNYPERKEKLEKAGYDYEKVQAKVDAILRK